MTTEELGCIKYIRNSGDATKNNLNIGLVNHPSLELYSDKISALLPIESSGDVTINGLCVAEGFNTVSDKRLKTNIEPITNSDLIYNIKPCQFNFVNQKDNKTHYGIIAQDLQQILPDLVNKNNSEKTILN